MALFWANCFSFPVSIFSCLLAVVILYGLIAAFGLFDLDGSEYISGEEFAGFLTKFGLSGVPITLVIALITLFGWLISYFSVHLFLRFIEITWLYYLLGLVILIATLLIAIKITAFTIRPLRRLFNKFDHTTNAQSLIGKMVEIRSSTVTEHNGQAIYEDGGAGMILQVRVMDEYVFKRGERAVIVSFDAVSHTYQIISENEFNGF